MKGKITAILATSDHDGYCSGETCFYETERMEFVIEVPQGMENKISEEHYNEWQYYLPEQKTGGGSHYCGLADECQANGLDRHEYKYTIISIEVVDNK